MMEAIPATPALEIAVEDKPSREMEAIPATPALEIAIEDKPSRKLSMMKFFSKFFSRKKKEARPCSSKYLALRHVVSMEMTDASHSRT